MTKAQLIQSQIDREKQIRDTNICRKTTKNSCDRVSEIEKQAARLTPVVLIAGFIVMLAMALSDLF